MHSAVRFTLLCLSAGIASAHSEDLRVAKGKERAAGSPLRWEVSEETHPAMGPIRFAVLARPVATSVGDAKVYSRIYVSCEKTTRTIAIELANSTAPEVPAGLMPKKRPRLICNALDAPNDARTVQHDLAARWALSPEGDALTQGLAPATLRECVSIDIVQEVVLPRGWSRETTLVQMQIAPYARELDQVFAACGQVAAYAADERPKAAPAVAAIGEATWKQARTTSRGKTNVRAKPTLDSAVVTELHPGDIVLVEKAAAPWWHVKSRPNRPAFEGFIREDRLVFK